MTETEVPRYISYCSKNNTIGLEQDWSAYWELDAEGHFLRSIEILANGDFIRYDEQHVSDSHGMLPEGPMTPELLSDASVGVVEEITKAAFEALWQKTAINRTHR